MRYDPYLWDMKIDELTHEMGYYRLHGDICFPVDSMLEWGLWMARCDTSIGRDQVGEALVSTVFLGIDHALPGQRPLLFETMIFGGALDQMRWRHSSRQEAKRFHKVLVKGLRRSRA